MTFALSCTLLYVTYDMLLLAYLDFGLGAIISIGTLAISVGTKINGIFKTLVCELGLSLSAAAVVPPFQQ